jgi:hypothetical protein
MTRGCEQTKIGWEWRKLRGERLTGEGKQKGGEREILGGDRKGAFNSPTVYTRLVVQLTLPISRSPRVSESLGHPVNPSILGRRASPHRFASFEPATALPTPAMLSIMLPPFTMPVVAIRNFRPHKQVGQTVVTNGQQMTNLPCV